LGPATAGLVRTSAKNAEAEPKMTLCDKEPRCRSCGVELSATAQFTVLAVPVLKIPSDGNNAKLSWASPDFVLQATTLLTAQPAWTDVPGGTNSPVTLPLTGTGQYFRLRESDY